MKIGIDVRMIQKFPTGIGNYRENLIKALAELRSSHEFVLIGNAGNKMRSWVGDQPRFKFAIVNSRPNSVHQHFLLPWELSKLNLDLFWTTPWGASVFLTTPYVLTIYDLLYFRYPEIASLKARLYDLFLAKTVARRAEVVFTISEFVKKDIENFLGIERDKIANIQGAAGDTFTPFNGAGSTSEARAVLQRWGIEKPFFVYLGNFRPHKNLKTLLRAFANFKFQNPNFKQIPNNNTSNVKMVLIGDVDAKGRDQDSRNLLKLLKELKLQGSVVLTGRIPDDREVAAILSQAVALVHPSFHEGFGLTVLEAMSCGCPVIAADTTSIPEVAGPPRLDERGEVEAGDAAILVDPHNVKELTGAMEKILVYYHNPVYGNRYQKLVDRGLEQAKKFSWPKTAKKVLNVIGKLTVNL
jgi:glycosyltransferase involved in cell wall biosynthesis